MLAFIFTILGIILMFSPLIIMNIYMVPIHYFFPYTFILGIVLLIIGWAIHFYLKNKKMDKRYKQKEFNVEENPKQKVITDEDKYFILENLEEFENRIGVGKKYYIDSFLKKKIPFNLGAAFGGLLWLGYRGLLKEAVYLLIGFTIIDILAIIIGIDLGNIIGIAISAVIGVLGNGLYFYKLKKDIKNNKQKLNPILGIIFVIILFIIYLIIIENLV